MNNLRARRKENADCHSRGSVQCFKYKKRCNPPRPPPTCLGPLSIDLARTKNCPTITMVQVTRKGKSVSPGKSPVKDTRFRATQLGETHRKKVTVPHDYFILRITPCPAETLKDLVGERRWMFKCRSMLLYITSKLHQLKQVGGRWFLSPFRLAIRLVLHERGL